MNNAIITNKKVIMDRVLSNGTEISISIELRNYDEKDKDELKRLIIRKARIMKCKAKESACLI